VWVRLVQLICKIRNYYEFNILFTLQRIIKCKNSYAVNIRERQGDACIPDQKLVPYAEEAKRKGRKVYHLNIGQPDIPTPEVALNAIRNLDLKVIEYSHSAGNESYRLKLAAYYRKIGINIDHTEILITTGGSEAILFALMTCLNPGDEVIIPEPYYANYNGFATTAGVKIVPVTSYIANDFALPPIPEIEKKITPKPKVLSFAIPIIQLDICIQRRNFFTSEIL